MDRLELKALGKINLGLDVKRKLDNGYHEVRMVMQTVYLYDSVILERKKEPGVSLTTNRAFLPTDEHNLAYRAAQLLLTQFPQDTGVKITLNKHIPVSAGMAGGSSDAAAVLEGINELFSIGLSEEALRERGVSLGADVPYCLMKGTALAEGIGEKLSPLPGMPSCYVLLAKPAFRVSTRRVYEQFDALKSVFHPDIDGIIDGLRASDLQAVADHMGNSLEAVTGKDYPVIRQIEAVMIGEGACGALMSGSGPTVFGLFEDRMRARKAGEKIRERKLARQVFVTNIHNTKRR